MNIDYASSILLSLRQIIRSIDKHNKQLSKSCNLTVPQLVCLRQMLVDGPTPIGRLAEDVYLSKATLTGIVDRLEAKGLVQRDRSTSDRRKVLLRLTDKGADMAKSLPWPLQERFKVSLASMDDEAIRMIDSTLKNLLDMMEAPDMKVCPYWSEDAIVSEGEIPARMQEVGEDE